MIYNPSIRPVEGSDNLYELVKPFEIGLRVNNKPIYLKIKPGFRFDGASIPSVLWGFPLMLHPTHPHILAGALVHDLLYETKGYPIRSEFIEAGACYMSVKDVLYLTPTEHIPKKVADDIFYRLNEISGMDKFRLKATYWAVRLFGRY